MAATTVKQQFKVLRLFEGSNHSPDWHPRGDKGYTQDEINNIEDPAASLKREVTSIPSPFARIHLFENAFESVTKKASKEGLITLDDNSAYHQLVSDALDVAEIFFHIDTFRNAGRKIEIKVWNVKDQIAELKSEEDTSLLGETMELFLEQDKVGSNFDKLNNFYVLICDNIEVGGTSPSTLFFSSFNDGYRLKDLNLGFADDKFFDDKLKPLYKRTIPFQRYIYGLFKVNKDLKNDLKLVWSYMEKNLEALRKHDNEAWKNLKNTIIDPASYDKEAFEKEFLSSGIVNENINEVEIFKGIFHRKCKPEIINYNNDDFAIDSKKVNEKRPLILVNGFNKPLNYCHGVWDKKTVVKYHDPLPLDERVLPGKMERYPYLTVSDFLEPVIFRLSFPLDEQHFFGGNGEGFMKSERESQTVGDDGYLLPLKRTFFDYFDLDFLRNERIGGKPVFRMSKIGIDTVHVELRIPIQKKNEFILYERMYKTGIEPNLDNNEGAVVPIRFNLGFSPFTNDGNNLMQYVVMVDSDTLQATKQFEYSLQFFPTSKSYPVSPANIVVRSDKHRHSHQGTTKFHVVKDPYDYIIVSNSQYEGLLIPNLKPKIGGDKAFTFAIDFGTTNSYLAFTEGEKNKAESFSIGRRDQQLITLNEDWIVTQPPFLGDLITREFLPHQIGPGEPYFFPMRTVVTEIEGININQALPMGDISIPFVFERKQLMEQEVLTTNLKWLKISDLDKDENNVRVEAFLSELLILIRNKILLNGGNLAKTKIVWFYPSSMGESTIPRFGKIWARLCKKYIHEQVQLVQYSESVAPVYAWGENRANSAHYPVVNIDIGGGTSDVAIFVGNKPYCTTSMRFAGNVLFGDGFNQRVAQENGFLLKFKPKIENWIDKNINKLFVLKSTYNSLLHLSSADINSYFFFLENNKELKDGDLQLSYSDLLSDDEDCKIAFLVFFGGLVYHVAKLMKTLNLDMPIAISMSGKASGVVKILDANPKLQNAANLAMLIFEKVYNEKYHDSKLKIECHTDPKESTCIGGVHLASDGKELPAFDSIVLLGDENGKISNPEQVNIPKSEVKYENIDDKLVESVEKEVRHFIKMLFDLHHEFNFTTKFGINAAHLNANKDRLLYNLKGHLKTGIQQRLERSNETEHVAESLFFYPLIGGLFNLIRSFSGN